ncbi:DgyrCDS12272 [Dimorphilus gyrociliatus]|uniref:DgyrCDS12272 n=1 Tax=Dimorphilus gyrociliatus TaxID=2664684 RepID=A0A7I8W5Z4_9ANNE|nr:DgyrCDS12272 [Dimorphilus gyrociliatus]
MACSRQLVPGDEFALRDDGLYCKADFEVVERGNNNNDSEIVMDNVDEQDVDSDNSSSTAVGQNSTSNNSTISSARSGTRNERGSRKSDHKTTRVRTVLNEKQLHTLRTCYAANPRPDALMKEQLVEMTGLSPRVIRVWFQNKRCKDKKKSILMKQMHEQQQKQVRWAKEPMGI